MAINDIIPANLLETLNTPRTGPERRPPAVILREQAEALRQTTHGLLAGAVASYTADGSTLVRHTFYLVVPALDDFSYSLFYVWHNTPAYPAHLLMVGQPQQNAVMCVNEEALESKLREIFRDELTLATMRDLVVQARSTMQR